MEQLARRQVAALVLELAEAPRERKHCRTAIRRLKPEPIPRSRTPADHGRRHLRAKPRQPPGLELLVIRDAAKRARLGELYREAWGELMKTPYDRGASAAPPDSARARCCELRN